MSDFALPPVTASWRLKHRKKGRGGGGVFQRGSVFEPEPAEDRVYVRIFPQDGFVKIVGTPPVRFQVPQEVLRWASMTEGELPLVRSGSDITSSWMLFVRTLGALRYPARVPWVAREALVEEALRDDRYQFRTAEGIARSTGLSPEQVRLALAELGSQVRGPLVPDPAGRELFTHADRRPNLQERYLALRARLATW